MTLNVKVNRVEYTLKNMTRFRIGYSHYAMRASDQNL